MFKNVIKLLVTFNLFVFVFEFKVVFLVVTDTQE